MRREEQQLVVFKQKNIKLTAPAKKLFQEERVIFQNRDKDLKKWESAKMDKLFPHIEEWNCLVLRASNYALTQTPTGKTSFTPLPTSSSLDSLPCISKKT